ncbi:unnamed protein product [Eretmochelys imbricata]
MSASIADLRDDLSPSSLTPRGADQEICTCLVSEKKSCSHPPAQSSNTCLFLKAPPAKLLCSRGASILVGDQTHRLIRPDLDKWGWIADSPKTEGRKEGRILHFTL